MAPPGLHPQVAHAQSVAPLDDMVTLLQDEQNTIQIVETYGTSVVALETSSVTLGVSVQAVDAYPESIRQNLKLPAASVVVTEVQTDSPVDATGLHGAQFTLVSEDERHTARGDVILAVNGEDVGSVETCQEVVASFTTGDKLELYTWRSGEEQTLTLSLAALQG